MGALIEEIRNIEKDTKITETIIKTITVISGQKHPEIVPGQYFQ